MAHLSYIYNSPNKQHFIFIQKKPVRSAKARLGFVISYALYIL